MTTSSGKHLEEIIHGHIASLMCKLITSARNTDDLPVGFDRDRRRGQRELTSNRKTKGKCHVTIKLKDIFGFAAHQEKATYGLGYNLILARTSDNAVLNRGNTVNTTEIKINGNHWYAQDFTLSLEQQKKY